MLSKLLKQGARNVIYLDPDIAVFATLEHVTALLEQHPVILTPHLTSPEKTLVGVVENEIGSLKHGSYNLGFIAVRNSDEGRRFAEWWQERLLTFCYDDIPAGLFTDQKWCDLVPSLFPGVQILRDPGYNVAGWNLSSRKIEIDADGTFLAAGVPLRFFHFTKLNSVGEALIQRHSQNDAAFELVRWYRERLERAPRRSLPPGFWAFANFKDGEAIQQRQRLLYRNHSELRETFKNPFLSGANTFQAWSKSTESEKLRANRSLAEAERALRRVQRDLKRTNQRLNAIEQSTSWRFLLRFQRLVNFVRRAGGSLRLKGRRPLTSEQEARPMEEARSQKAQR